MEGTYILFLEAKKDIEPEVGRLGRIKLAKGLYAYVGRAMGKSANLENRISRHKKLAKENKGNRQWHIDYITTSKGVDITGIVRVAGKDIECESAKLMEATGGKVVADGFGSSDCKCKTHFFSIDQSVADSFIKVLPDLF